MNQTKETNVYPIINSSIYMSFSSITYEVNKVLEEGLIACNLIEITYNNIAPEEIVNIPKTFFLNVKTGRILNEEREEIATTKIIR